jgi:hypothetical protein
LRLATVRHAVRRPALRTNIRVLATKAAETGPNIKDQLAG